MTSLAWCAAGAASLALAAGLAGYSHGGQIVQGRWDAERGQQAREVSARLERAMERQVAAQAVADAVDRRLRLALRENRDAPRPRVECPPTGDVRDAVLPGLAERLRRIDAAGTDEGGAPVVEPVPAGAAGR